MGILDGAVQVVNPFQEDMIIIKKEELFYVSKFQIMNLWEKYKVMIANHIMW